MLDAGFSRKEVVLCFYAPTLVFLGMGMLAYWSRGRMVPMLLGILVALLLALARRLEFSREWFSVGRVLGNSLGIRRQVQHAGALLRRAELKGGRRSNVSLVWSDFMTAARRHGFSSVELTLEDGHRAWRDETISAPVHKASFQIKGGRLGELRFEGMRCPLRPTRQCRKLASRASCPCDLQRRMFEIFCDMTVESWTRTALNLAEPNGQRLRFARNEMNSVDRRIIAC